jgi:hypothetical protein
MNDLPHMEDDGLSPAGHAALAALRAEEEMPADARERVWARLEEASAQVRPRASGRALWRGAVIGLAIAAGLALALIELGRGAQPITQAPRGDAARYDGAAPTGEWAARQGAPAAVPGASRTQAAASETVVVGQGGEAPQGDRPARGEAVPEGRSVRGEAVPEGRSMRAGPEVVAAPVDGGALAAEAALLQRAQTALAAGDPEAALARLGEHTRGFKDGVLARERDALRVTALCAAGRTTEGRAEAEAFLKAHAGSLLAERVRGACEP